MALVVDEARRPFARETACGIAVRLPLLGFQPGGRHMPVGRRQPPAQVRSTAQARMGDTRPPE